MEQDLMTETVEQGVQPAVLAFLDEAPREYWDALTNLLFDKIEGIISKYKWIGRSAPEACEVFNDAYTAIFVTGKYKWNPNRRNSPSEFVNLSNDWTPCMWSLYRHLTEKIIQLRGNNRRISFLEAIISNIATLHSNSKNCLTDDVTMTANPEANELSVVAGDYEKGDAPTTGPEINEKKNIYYISPRSPVMPDKKAIANDEWQIMQRCIYDSDFENKDFLTAVIKHIWFMGPVKDNETPTPEDGQWKVEDCVTEIANQFPNQTMVEIRQGVYRAKARHLRPIAVEYEFVRFLDSLPKELREFTRFYRSNLDMPLNVRLEQFSSKANIPVAKVAAMHMEFERFRDGWESSPLSNLIKKQLGSLCETTERN